MSWFRGVALVAAALVTSIGFVAAIGTRLPKGHLARCRVRLSATPEQVFGTITDFKNMPTWRKDLKQVELLEPQNGKIGFVETSRHGRIRYEVDEHQAPSRLVTRIADETLPFGGTWTYELTATGAGTQLTVTEQGEVRNPIFRFLSHYVFSQTATMEGYLRSLGQLLGETVVVEVLASGK
jgi:uncharacterized protein YndB with AHSA1/START domain